MRKRLDLLGSGSIKGIYTATIGSFPLEDSIESRVRCLRDLLNVGIDFPNYPQLVEMGEQFLEDLVKECNILRGEKGGYMLEGDRLEPPSSPPGVEPFNWALNYLKERGLHKKVRLRASITGPFTLASYIEIREGRTFPFNRAVSEIELVRQLSEAVSMSCRSVAEGASMISIDEPVLSMIVGLRIPFNYGEEEIVDIYNSLKRSCGKVPVGTHICGRISPRLAETLLQTDLDFLSHEFHDTPKNFEVYKPDDVRRSGKIISVGCVSSKNPKVETVKEILNIVEASIKRYGCNIIFTPDCGFKKLIPEGSRELGYRASIKKLKNLVHAVRKVRSRETSQP